MRALNPTAPILYARQGVIDPAILDAGLYDPTTKTLDVRRWLSAEAFDDPAHNPRHELPAHDHAHHDSAHHDSAHHDHAHHDHAHHDHAHHDVNRHDQRIRAVCLTLDKPVSRLLFDLWLDILMQIKGPDLLRVKGIVRIAEFPGPLVIHGVQHIFHPPISLAAWPSADHRTRLVLITRDIDEEWLRNTLALFDVVSVPTPT